MCLYQWVFFKKQTVYLDIENPKSEFQNPNPDFAIEFTLNDDKEAVFFLTLNPTKVRALAMKHIINKVTNNYFELWVVNQKQHFTEQQRFRFYGFHVQANGA